MQSDDPPYIDVGTEVSAKFKGAFCEAKVLRVSKSVRCKVQLKVPPYGSIFVEHTFINGPLELNQPVEVIQGETTLKGILQSFKDNSEYVVVFDDGDERQLRRTHVCLKGAKHYEGKCNLDTLPLYNPEQFSSPVIKQRTHASRKEWNKKSTTERKSDLENNIGALVSDNSVNDDVDDNQVSELDESTSPTSNSSNSHFSSSTRILTNPSVVVTNSGASHLTYVSPSTVTPAATTHDTTSSRINISTDSEHKSEVRIKQFARHSSLTHSVSRAVADKILNKSIARTRQKRTAAAAAVLAMRGRIGHRGRGRHRRSHSKLPDDYCSGSESDATDTTNGPIVCGGQRDNAHVGNDQSEHSSTANADGRHSWRRLRKQFIYSTEREDSGEEPESDPHQKSATMGDSRPSQRRRYSHKRTLPSDSEPVIKKRLIDISELRKQFVPGTVVAMFENANRSGQWVPSVVVSENLCKKFVKAPPLAIKNCALLRSFKDGKYYLSSFKRLIQLGAPELKMANVISKAPLGRATLFSNKGIMPIGWEWKEMFDDDASGRRNVHSAGPSKRVESDKVSKLGKEVKQASTSENSSSEDSGDDDYNQARDQFTAQLYKFHEERGTPINRAPVLGGKDIVMFRLYNVVQRYGGKKRVNENNLWRKVLRKMHLEGRAGATPITIRHAYTRYLEPFNPFYRNLGISSWLMTPSSSGRSERPNRLRDRQAFTAMRSKMSSSDTKRKDRKEISGRTKISKAEKDDEQGSSKSVKKITTKKSTKADSAKEEDDPIACLGAASSVKSDDKSIRARNKSVEREEERQNVDEKTSSSETSKTSSGDSSIRDADDTTYRVGISKKDEKDSNRGRKYLQRSSIRKNAEKTKRGSDAAKSIHTRKVSKDIKSSKRHKLIAAQNPSNRSSISNYEMEEESESDEEPPRHIRRKTAEKRKISDTSAIAKEADIGGRWSRDSKITNENCTASTILTQFYSGQDVKAYHHGQWYNARVITVGKDSHNDVLSTFLDFEARCKAIDDSVGCTDDERGCSLKSASAWLNNRLEEILNDIRCCVHYLGWNARYDEWIQLTKIKVLEQDQNESIKIFTNLTAKKLSNTMLGTAIAWRSSVQPFSSDKFEKTSRGARYRRPSQNYSEQSSVIGAEKSKSRSRSRSTTISEKRTLKKSQQAAKSNVLINPADDNQNEPKSISKSSVSAMQQIAASFEAESSSPVSEIRHQSAVGDAATKEKSENILQSEDSTAQSSTCVSKVQVEICESSSSALFRRRTVSETCSTVAQLHQEAKATCSNTSGAQQQQSEDCKLSMEGGFAHEVIGKNLMKEYESDESTERSSDDNSGTSTLPEIVETASATVEEVFQPPREFELKPSEEIFEELDQVPSTSEIAMNKSEIATKESEIDDDQGLPQELQTMSGSQANDQLLDVNVDQEIASSSRSRHNEMHSRENEDTVSADYELLPSVRDSWHTVKVRMQQKMEQNNEFANAEALLGFAPIRGLSGEPLIAKLEERLQQLREVHHAARMRQALLDRRWRKTLEQKRLRDREIKTRGESLMRPFADADSPQ